jgi:hypothetical protein
MIRPTALRSLRGALPSSNASVSRASWRGTAFKSRSTQQSSVGKSTKRMSLAIRSPVITSLVRHRSTVPKGTDPEVYEVYMQEKLQAQPELVSSGSSVRHTTYEVGTEDPEPDIDMMAGIRSDWVSRDPYTAVPQTNQIWS